MSKEGAFTFEEFLERAERLPSMPAVALEVLRLTRDEATTLDELTEALSLDPALSVRMLKLANSSFFNVGRSVSNLQRATLMLGMKTVKLMALGFSLVESFSPGEGSTFDTHQYWRRSVIRAAAMRSLASKLKNSLEDEGFLCGLLSRVGQLVMMTCEGERYSEIALEGSEVWPSAAAEHAVFGFDGAKLGGALLESWLLPEPVSGCVSSGGEPSRLPGSAARETLELARMMSVAALCEELFCGQNPREMFDCVANRVEEYWDLETDELEEWLGGLGCFVAETAQMLDMEIGEVGLEQILQESRDALIRETEDVAGEVLQARVRESLLQEQNERLEKEAHIDSLTELPSRAVFEKALDLCVEEMQHGRLKGGLGVLMIDVDDFKSVNDTFGHRVGDAVLKRVADSIRLSTRRDEVGVRYGGDEFGALLIGLGEKDMAPIGERIRAAVASSGDELEDCPSVTVSVGGAFAASVSANANTEVIVDLADKNLYEAKRAGRNCVRITNVQSQQESKMPEK